MISNISRALPLFVLVSLASPLASHAQTRELTPNDDLIFAVKGVKLGAAALATLVNPVLGLLVYAYEPGESASDLEAIDRALSRGAYIDHQEKGSGYTALIYAAYKGYPGIAAHLIKKGANVQIKEEGGYNAYTMAQYYVNRYTRWLADNDSKPLTANFDAQKRAEMHEHYVQLIAQYKQIVGMLAYKTYDKVMPRAWFS